MSGPLGRRGLALLVVLVAALAAGRATPAAHQTALKQLSAAGLGAGSGHVHSRLLTHNTRRLASFPSTAWGGTYTTKTGESVTIYSSNAYPVDHASNQAAADYIDSLVHGPELSEVRIYFAPADEVGILCGSTDADGCYSPATGEIVSIGEDSQWSTVEEVVTHEYGHHVAAHRLNAPWSAVAWGTKRWATYEGICAKEAAGRAFPGDEGDHYLQNPGEAFAESFLHLNEVKLGVDETPWGYDPMFAPDAKALAALEQDVVAPWTSYSLRRWTGRFARRRQIGIAVLGTPLDGVVAVQLKGPRGSSIRLTGALHQKRASQTLVSGLICGQRTLITRVTGGGAGRFQVTAATP
ncbi:MAG: hypothetical protein QOH23_2298 [Gaiellaceae bacterium]|jgi:hypothetical protein|nr:hypothetical protein [Gaiellaceae bacterium]